MAVLMIGSIFCDLLVKLTVRYFPRESGFLSPFLSTLLMLCIETRLDAESVGLCLLV